MYSSHLRGSCRTTSHHRMDLSCQTGRHLVEGLSISRNLRKLFIMNDLHAQYSSNVELISRRSLQRLAQFSVVCWSLQCCRVSTNRQETGESDRGRLPLSVCAACSCQCPLWLVAAASRRRVQLRVLYISTPVLDSRHTHRQTHQSRPQPPSTMSRLPRQQ